MKIVGKKWEIYDNTIITIKFQPTLTTVLHANIFKIWVPQAAYQFLGAMDRLIGQLPAEAPANPPPILATQMAEGGISNNFQLSVLWSERQQMWSKNKKMWRRWLMMLMGRIARVAPEKKNVGGTCQNRADWQIAENSGMDNARFFF
jgi:hypothetical protein